MDSDIQKIRKLTKFMRAQGILELKMGDIELKLDAQAVAARAKPAPEKKKAKTESEVQQETMDREQRGLRTLLWSSPQAHSVPEVG